MGAKTATRKGSKGSKRPLEARSGVGSATTTASQRRPAGKYSDPLHWVEGQKPDGGWVPLYCSRNELLARHWCKALILLPEDSHRAEVEGVGEYEDFRVVLGG